MSSQVLQIIGLVAAISTALVGQSHLVGEPWIHILSVVGVVSSAIVAFYMKPPRDINSLDRIYDYKLKGK